MDAEKKFSKCEAFSLKSNFYKDITKTDGYRPQYKNCTKQYQYRNREKRNLRERKRRAVDFEYRLIKKLKIRDVEFIGL